MNQAIHPKSPCSKSILTEENMTVRKAVCIMLLGILTSGGLDLTAQTTTAILRGTVGDPSSAPIPGAEVTVTNTATGLTRKVTTNDVGDYVIPDLPYGPYEIVVVKQGFQRLSRQRRCSEYRRPSSTGSSTCTWRSHGNTRCEC